MSINLYEVELIGRARHQELLQEAARRRLVKQAQAGRPKKVGAATTFGAWLRSLFRRPAPQEPIPCVQVAC